MDIIQNFYDNLASDYDKLFYNWQDTTKEQALILDNLFNEYGYDNKSHILDCACGIGTQAIGLANLGYHVVASDISSEEIKQARKRAENQNADIIFENADFRELSQKFDQKFDIIIAMDNALPHMLTKTDLKKALCSIVDQLSLNGMFVASIRDYDILLQNKPPYSPPYIHKTQNGQRVSFQTWEWEDDIYKLVQYIIEDGNTLNISKFECVYRAVLREEITNILMSYGCSCVEWKFPEQTGFYQPIVIAKK
jgi:SAM-dependent methyltransferase